MLVYPKIAREVCRIRLFSWFVVAGAEKTGQPCWFIRKQKLEQLTPAAGTMAELS